MALSSDVKTVRYGSPGNSTQPVNKPANSGITVYRGSIALCDSTGNVKNSSSPASTDTCWGIIEDAWSGAMPSSVFNGPGIVIPASTTNGVVSIEIETGSFWLASSTGADAITEANVGATVYVADETHVALTTGGGRPVAGIVLAVDSSLGIAVKLGPVAGTTGGPS